MVAGSFFLTPATALRYERHDRKVRQLTKEEELGIGRDRRKVDLNEEYYRLAAKVSVGFFGGVGGERVGWKGGGIVEDVEWWNCGVVEDVC